MKSYRVFERDGWTVLPQRALRVRNAQELGRLVELLCDLSGLPKRVVAARAGIARSQLYSLIGGRLPRDPGQLQAVLTACGLHPAQVEGVVHEWRGLKEGRR